MTRTVEVRLLGTVFTCEVDVTGPAVDDWNEISIRSEENLIEVLQNWCRAPAWTQYEELLDKIADKLREEGIVQ